MRWMTTFFFAAFALVPALARASPEFAASGGKQASPHNGLPGFGFVLRANYGIGRNFTPSSGSLESAYVSAPSLEIGLGAPGLFQITGELQGLFGHNDQTSSDILIGPSIRLTSQKLGGVYGRMSVGISPASSEREQQTKHTVLFGLYGGLAVPVDAMEMNLEAGIVLGEHREDGFLALAEIRIGFGWIYPWSKL